MCRVISRWLGPRDWRALSPLPPGEGAGVRGWCRGISLQAGRYPPFPHPKPLSRRERGLTPLQREMALARCETVRRRSAGVSCLGPTSDPAALRRSSRPVRVCSDTPVWDTMPQGQCHSVSGAGVAQAPVNRVRTRGSRTAELVAVSRARHLLQHDKPSDSRHETHSDEGCVILGVYRKPNVFRSSAGF